MTSWNFERRKSVCGAFVVGVSLATKGKPNVATTLEAVRSKMRLPPEDALFAARRLAEEQLITFDEPNDVRSNAKGIAHADEIVGAAIAKTHAIDDVTRTLDAGGLPLALLRVAVLANGGALPCGAVDASAATHRLACTKDVVTLEERSADGSFVVVTR